MTFGETGKDGARVHDLKDVEAILDVFLKHGHREVMPIPSVGITTAQLIRSIPLASIVVAQARSTSGRLTGREKVS